MSTTSTHPIDLEAEATAIALAQNLRAIEPSGPIATAFDHMIGRLYEIGLPKEFPVRPTPGHFQALREHLADVATAIDDYLAAIGSEVADNSYFKVDRSVFHGVVEGATSDAAGTCSAIAERMIEEREVA